MENRKKISLKYTALRKDDGSRVDVVASQNFSNFSRAHIQRWIKDGNLLVNGKEIKVARNPNKNFQILTPAVNIIIVPSNKYMIDVPKSGCNIIKIKGPSLNFDKKGFFKEPKIIKKYKITENKDYLNSLLKSVSFFLDHVKKRKKFNKKIWNCSLKSNELIL